MREAPITDSYRLCITSGYALVILFLSYAIILAIGLVNLPSPDHQIENPWFSLLEILILAIAPTMVIFAVGLHALVSEDRKSFALLSIVFLSLCAVLTCAVHFAVLTLSRQPAFAATEWSRLVFSFTWPSVVYALDILAWDVFFPLGALFVAFSIQTTGPARVARGFLFGSAGLAFLGLAGVPLANMNIRNIGILGYVVLFPIAALLLANYYRRLSRQNAA